MDQTRPDPAPGPARHPVAPPPSALGGDGVAERPQMPARHSVRDQVLAELRAALAGGGLLAGQVYSARSLAERYGVSATPVREAMQRLASEGAVEVVPNRGFRVAGLSDRDLVELAEVRTALEVPAVLNLLRRPRPGPRASATSRTGRGEPENRSTEAAGRQCLTSAPGWSALRAVADASVAAAGRGDRHGYAEADLAFHRGLLELTGNRQLTEVAVEMLRRSQAPVAGRPASPPSVLRATALQHVALLDALAEGEATLAERLLRDHLTRV
ncbi:GntR family transcriptional regulator [Streptomyces spiramenti]|uniref:GntR family transcriptional regulator n=1 Tax=Streptomyces spiramenti TaxID=2720606 RepID=A0ABX1AKG6_9ACTN|nr:GntR family transcriptional regulator [Streptomyces spiramenti]NJP65103.1 GntR family transcriptional regulator [Streptomyces spiramenti]